MGASYALTGSDVIIINDIKNNCLTFLWVVYYYRLVLQFVKRKCKYV